MKMKAACESCQGALPHEAEAYVCSYECTFCPACTARMHATCPNCSGELLRRPRRVPAPAAP
jgi:hypothetical protein